MDHSWRDPLFFRVHLTNETLLGKAHKVPGLYSSSIYSVGAQNYIIIVLFERFVWWHAIKSVSSLKSVFKYSSYLYCILKLCIELISFCMSQIRFKA